MSDDQFTKLFQYVEKRFSDMDTKFEEVRQDQADVRAAIAELSSQVRDYHNETLILTHQVDRLREAIIQIAKETGVKLAVNL